MRRTTVALLSLSLVLMPAASLAQEDVTDETVGLGGRVEVSSAGYAVTLPEDWIHVRPTPGDVDVILDAVAAVAPELGPTVEAALAGGLGFSLLAFDGNGEGFRQNCNVLDRAADGSSVDLVAATEVMKMDALGDIIASGPALTFIELPSGRTARLDVGIRLPDLQTESTSYVLVDETWIHTMTCTNDVRPADAWYPIAESFEFRPTTD